MKDARARGAILYGTAAVLLAAGATWWIAAAPELRDDPKLESWRATAERGLPTTPYQDDADTVTLPAGVDHEVLANAGSGVYQVAVLCVGEGDSRVRVSLGALGTDSGRGLSCSEIPEPEMFPVSITGQLRMKVSVSEEGPVVFRYALQRQP